jgi:hypothetical protein
MAKKQQADKSVSVAPVINRERAFRSVCPKYRPTLTRVVEALRELVTNGEDEGADDIRIFIEKSKKEFRIHDNGRGFGARQKKGFFWLFESEKTDRSGKKKPTGQHGTGRLQTLRFADCITPCSSSHEDAGFYKTSLSRADAQAIWEGDTTARKWTPCSKPSHWHLPPKAHGSVVDITVSDEHWKGMPSVKQIIDELGKHLSPRLERQVTVNGKNLKPRAVAKSFTQSFDRAALEEELGAEAAAALGDCLVDLYMPEKLERGNDDIKLGGAKNTICSLWDFLMSLPETDLQDALPSLLTSRSHLFGYVFIEGLNEHAAEDRKTLKDSVYDGMHKHVIRFLADVVGPLIEEAYAKKEAEEARSKRKKSLVDFCRELKKAFDPGKGTLADEDSEETVEDGLPSGTAKEEEKETKRPAISVKPGWFHAIAGETQPIEVTFHEGIKETDLEWVTDGVSECGAISKETGKSTIFTAQKVGSGTLVVRNKQDHEQCAEVRIQVVDEKKLQISPPNVPVEQGSTQRFRARNHESTSGNIGWKLVTKTRGIRLSNTKGLGTTLTVADEAKLGVYEIECWDVDNDTIQCTGRFEVVPADTPSFVLDGKTYYPRVSTVPQPEPVILQQDCLFMKGKKKGKAGKVEIDFDHADFKNLLALGGEDEATRMMMFESIIILHLDKELAAGNLLSASEMTTRFHELRSKFLADRVAAGKKK